MGILNAPDSIELSGALGIPVSFIFLGGLTTNDSIELHGYLHWDASFLQDGALSGS